MAAPIIDRQRDLIDQTIPAGFQRPRQFIGGTGCTKQIEYLFADLGEATRQIGTYLRVPCCVQAASVREEVAMHMVRFGVNYRFTPQ